MRFRRLVAPRENFGDKAPITEALIDIRATIGPDVSLDALKAFAEPWPSDFPQMRTQTQWAGQIRVDAASASVTGEHGVRGFVFLDETGRHVVQVRRDGFTYSKLHPYAKWEDLRDRAKALWQRYREVAAPLQVVRVGVRYINRLKLPAGLVQLPEWFGIHPVLAPELGPMSESSRSTSDGHPLRPPPRLAVPRRTSPTRPGRPRFRRRLRNPPARSRRRLRSRCSVAGATLR